MVSSGTIETFVTGLTGEVFSALRSNGVLVPKNVQVSDVPDTAFEAGVEASVREDFSLLHGLIGVRTKQIFEEYSPEEAANYFSGMLIGADISGGLRSLKCEASGPVYIIGANAVSQRYAVALSKFGMTSIRVSSTEAAVAGFASIASIS